MARNLIITSAVNYSARDIQVLLASAARHAPGATFLIFHDRTDADFRAELRHLHPDVRLIRPDDLDRRAPLWRRSNRRRRLRYLPPAQARYWSLRLRLPWRRRATARLHIVMARYFWILDALRLPWTFEFDNILLCDSRDVCFQADPFATMPGELVVGAWNVPFSRRTEAVAWLRSRFPPAVAERVLPQPNLSNGLILGTRPAVHRFLRVFTRDIAALRPHPFGQTGDQRLINTTLHGSDRVPFVMTHTGGPIMAHLIQTDWKRLVIDEGGLKTCDGETVALLHHYEYNGKLRNLIEQQYGAGAGARPKMHPVRR